MDLAAVETIVRNLNITRYVSAGACVVLLYDHLLTLDDEIQYIWKTKTTVPKVLFLLNRYLVPIVMIVNMYEIAGLSSSHPSDLFCKVWFPATTFLGSISIANGHFIVMLRIWVLWNRRTKPVVFTLVAFVLSQIVTFSMVIWAAIQMIPLFEYNTLLRACVIKKRIIIEGVWLPGVIFEIIVFAMTCWNAMGRPRQSNHEITNTLYRDGVTFFLTMASLRIANLVLSIVAPLSLVFLGIFFIWCATNVTLSRLIINVRRHSEESLLASASLEHLDADPEGDHELRVHRSMTYETFPERFELH